MKKKSTFLLCCLFLCCPLFAQVVINEGSNKNYSSIQDEDGDYPDWIELYNFSADTLSLLGYSLTDNEENPTKWTFPNTQLPPLGFRTVFCSGKNRTPISGFSTAVDTSAFTPTIGWNTHLFEAPFYWDGVSNILINTCSFSQTGYTSNSVFNQTQTDFLSSAFLVQDGSNAICSQNYATPVAQRPLIRFNGITIGTANLQNSPTDYPAPYGNWYWAAKHQFLIRADELLSAGLTAGNLSNIAFDVVSTDPNTVYDNLTISLKLTNQNELETTLDIVDPNNNLHTNFKIARTGEKIFLYTPTQQLASSLFVNVNNLDNSTGYAPDASSNLVLFQTATPAATNNAQTSYTAYLQAPTFSVTSGIYQQAFELTISNPNTLSSQIYYTTNGSDPNPNTATLYNGNPIPIFYSTVLKARVFADSLLHSPDAVASYLLGIAHTTPILSLVTDNNNLYGPTGIFDNWATDWERAAYVEYFDSTQQRIFAQKAGIQIDGGWGGSRSHPQHSFRVELDDSVLGEGSIEDHIIPNRPNRTKYSDFYLRNGSNQYLLLPYKDAAQVEMMAGATKVYYSAWRPITVYINGNYFGLYELREKFDTEYFKSIDNADADSIDILSLSAWGNGVLRPIEGTTTNFFDDYQQFNNIEPTASNYWQQADQYFDLQAYTDYIIGQSWMGNTDWPGNNIKLYRSNATDFRWRFCLIDQELAMAPNAWSDASFDHIDYMLQQDPNNPYINIWLKSMQNEQYRHFFINRYADVMNTAYLNERLLGIEQNCFEQTVIEMQNEYARWGDPNNISSQMQSFYDNHLTFRSQLSTRTEQVRNHLQNHFNLPNQLTVTLYTQPEGSGSIRISTITPDSNPWQGVYFNGVPIQIEAIPAQGYQFSHWSDNDMVTNHLNPLFDGILNAEQALFQANFAPVNTGTDPTSNSTQHSFSIYPNPAQNQLFIQQTPYPSTNNTSKWCQIVDMTGRIVQSKQLLLANNPMNISQLPSSVYLCQILENGNITAQFKWVKVDH